MQKSILSAINLITVLGWLPILIKFANSFFARKAPESIAIAQLVLFAMFVAILQIEDQSIHISIVNFIACAAFHAAIWVADAKFPDRRR